MSSKLPTIWDADPHTIAKIEILKYYLQAWFPILARNSTRPILYVDGFAGPGHYRNYDKGSPVVALEAIESSIEKHGDALMNRDVNMAFIEEDAKRFDVLKESLSKRKGKSVRIIENCLTFVEGIRQLQQNFIGNFIGGDPLLVFADPFGGTDIPLEVFAGCMKGERSELLVNLDADGIARIYEGKNNNWDRQLDEVFGGRCWEKELGSDSVGLTEKAKNILHLYKKRLVEIVGAEYVFAFEMRGKTDRINYYLVFATKHPTGMVRMKEAMNRVDQNGSFRFSDADEGQIFLFSESENEDYASKLWNHYLNKIVPYHEVEKFCLCETPVKSPGVLLRILEKNQKLEVHQKPGLVRKKGSFRREVIESIRFTNASDQLTLL